MWFNPNCFSLEPFGTLGNFAREGLYGPGLVNLDMALLKSTKIRENMNLQFRAELFEHFKPHQPVVSGFGPVLGNAQCDHNARPLGDGRPNYDFRRTLARDTTRIEASVLTRSLVVILGRVRILSAAIFISSLFAQRRALRIHSVFIPMSSALFTPIELRGRPRPE